MVEARAGDGPVVILKTGEKLPALAQVAGDFEDWICHGMGVPRQQVQVVAVHRGVALPDPGVVGAVVITGSAAMVSDHSEWIERSARWLREVVSEGIPVLGICFGHQLLAYATGGQVGDNSNGIEVGTVSLRLQTAAQTDTLFSTLPHSLAVHASHRQAVSKLPPQAVWLASSALDPHHAFRIGQCAWGVQFHPEFDARITAAYVEFYRCRISGSERSGASLPNQQPYETPYGIEVLRSFAHVVRAYGRCTSPQDAS